MRHGRRTLRPPNVLNCSPLPTNYLTQNPLSSKNKLISLTSMSHTHPTAASSSSSSPNYQLIINSALDTYNKRTRKDLRAHPLAAQLQACETPTAILAVLQHQVQDLDRSRTTDERWTKWLDPTVNVLYNFSNIIGAGVSLVSFRIYNYLRSALICDRYSHLRASFLPELGSSFQCVYHLSTLSGPS